MNACKRLYFAKNQLQMSFYKMKTQIKTLKKLWKNYKYRFTPWIALNLGKEAKQSQKVCQRLVSMISSHS